MGSKTFTLTEVPTLESLLMRYKKHPPHALLLTSRRFSTPAGVDSTEPKSKTEETAKHSHWTEYSGLLACEVQDLAESLCGFTFQMSPTQSPEEPASNLKHFDYTYIAGSRRTLRREDIESLFERLRYSPQVAKRRLVIIERAQRLTAHAANALLKSIEEPTTQVVFVLTAPSVSHILPTIASRCMRLHIPPRGETEGSSGSTGGVSGASSSFFESSERAFLQRIAERLSHCPLHDVLSPARESLASSRQLNDDLDLLEVLGKEHSAEEIIDELLNLAVQVRSKWLLEGHAPHLHEHSLGWLTRKLRAWQQAREYNPSTTLRLCELVLASQRGIQTQRNGPSKINSHEKRLEHI